MYRNILLGTDGSAIADTATEYAIWFAKKLRTRLHVLYITDIRILEGPLLADISGALGAQPYAALLPQLREIQRAKSDTILGAAAKRCEKQGVSCELTHETGNLVESILNQEGQADLVVLGQRGEHAQWSRTMLGSSVERVVRASVKPCLVTPEKFREIKHVLLAYDGSAESQKALGTGIDIAQALGAEATIITVCQPRSERGQRENEDAASKVLQDGHRLALDRKLKAQAQLLHGNAETEILGAADKFGADLIVMGAYGHTRIRELILGSTTSHVLRNATVPVLLTRS